SVAGAVSRGRWQLWREDLQREQHVGRDVGGAGGNRVPPRQRPAHRRRGRSHGRGECYAREHRELLPRAPEYPRALGLRCELLQAPRSPRHGYAAESVPARVPRAGDSRIDHWPEPLYVGKGAEHRSRNGTQLVESDRLGAGSASYCAQHRAAALDHAVDTRLLVAMEVDVAVEPGLKRSVTGCERGPLQKRHGCREPVTPPPGGRHKVPHSRDSLWGHLRANGIASNIRFCLLWVYGMERRGR